MDTPEALEVCEGWFAYIERQKQKSIEVQKLAAMSRAGQGDEARRRLRQLDSTSLTVYDGARLEPAVRHLVMMARSRVTTSRSCGCINICVADKPGLESGVYCRKSAVRTT